MLGEAIRGEPELARRKQFSKLLSRRSFGDQGEEAEDPREHLFVQKLVQVDLFKKQQGLGNIEIALSALSKRDRDSLSVEDTYKLDTGSATYDVLGTPITVANPLGQALRFLPPQRREVLLLCYFAEMSDPQIGKILNLTAAAVNYRRKKALDALRTILEAMDLDEA